MQGARRALRRPWRPRSSSASAFPSFRVSGSLAPQLLRPTPEGLVEPLGIACFSYSVVEQRSVELPQKSVPPRPCPVSSVPWPPWRESSPCPPISASFDEPPWRTSFPFPPRIRSRPPKPLIWSFPPSPQMTSLPGVPFKATSSPGVPSTVQLWNAEKFGWSAHGKKSTSWLVDATTPMFQSDGPLERPHQFSVASITELPASSFTTPCVFEIAILTRCTWS